MAQALTEPGEAIQRPLLGFRSESMAFVQTGRQLHHFLEAVENLHLIVHDPGYDHVKAVGAQIDGGNVVVDIGHWL